MLKQGTAKIQLGSSIIQKAKIRGGWSFLQLETVKQGAVGVLSIENDKIRYIWGITLFRKQKQVTGGVFFY